MNDKKKKFYKRAQLRRMRKRDKDMLKRKRQVTSAFTHSLTSPTSPLLLYHSFSSRLSSLSSACICICIAPLSLTLWLSLTFPISRSLSDSLFIPAGHPKAVWAAWKALCRHPTAGMVLYGMVLYGIVLKHLCWDHTHTLIHIHWYADTHTTHTLTTYLQVGVIQEFIRSNEVTTSGAVLYCRFTEIYLRFTEIYSDLLYCTCMLCWNIHTQKTKKQKNKQTSKRNKTLLYCTVLYYVVLCCIGQHCTVLHTYIHTYIHIFT